MSNFWADRLAGRPAASASPTPAQISPWRVQPTYAPAPEPAPGPAPVPREAPRQVAAAAPGPMRADVQCPNCGGANYGKPTPNTAARCMDCNYPILHSTSGAVIPNRHNTPARSSLRQAQGSGSVTEIIGYI